MKTEVHRGKRRRTFNLEQVKLFCSCSSCRRDSVLKERAGRLFSWAWSQPVFWLERSKPPRQFAPLLHWVHCRVLNGTAWSVGHRGGFVVEMRTVMRFERFCVLYVGGCGCDDGDLVFNIRAAYFVHSGGRVEVDENGAKRICDIGWNGGDDGRMGGVEKEVWRSAGPGGECEIGGGRCGRL